MSFFGFEQPIDLEEEKRKILEGAGRGEGEDLAVYTWGEESYDGLGDALQEGGDELNDETFGGSGAVGKDFDFASQALPTNDLAGVSIARESMNYRNQRQVQYQQEQSSAQVHQPRAASRPVHSLEAIWDNTSPLSVLSNQNGSTSAPAPPPVQRRAHEQHAPTPPSGFSPFDLESEQQAVLPRQQLSMALSLGVDQTHGVRTLEEIEAEMREAFAAQRLQNQSPSQAQLLQQAQLRNVAQRHTPQHYGQGSTPPPRMHAHAQSPRFQQQQQQQQHHQLLLQQQQQQMQLLELQELRERRQRQQLLELQEQLRLEELERARHQQQLRAQQHLQHQRQSSSGTPLGEGQYRRQVQRAGTPSRLHHQQQQQVDVPFQQNLQYLPREIQMQQKLLAEMAQAEFLHSLQGSPVNPAEDKDLQEQLRAEAMRKIMEAERMEEKRKRRLEKIRYMSRYNDLMTQSDKDFITRIQVSQLVTQDPFSDDFYAQVYGRLLHNRLGVNAPEAVLKFGSGGGVGLGLGQAKGGRRQSAMQRMEQQVERIVNNARLREKEKITLNNLQGALGKTAGRSYKAAPRQLLQVHSGAGNGPESPSLSHAQINKADGTLSTTGGEGAAQKAAEIGHEALQGHGKLFEKKDPLTHREILVTLERIFDIIMELDRLKEDQPPPESESELLEQEERFSATVSRLFDALRVGVPLETSVPHPFISIITPVKGKKMFPRALRYIEQSRHLTVMTLILACFTQLDVVKNSSILDLIVDSPERKEAEKQLDAFIHHVMHALLPVAATAGVRLIRGLLGVLMTRNDIGAIARTRPGIFILTLFISRIEQMSQEGWAFPEDAPTAEDIAEWQDLFNQLFILLSPHLLFLFPSVRQAVTNNVPLANVPNSDEVDQPVWQFLAILAAHAAVEQQQILVSAVKERVLESVASANKGHGIKSEEERVKRLANVNIFLHALGLDSSQITS
ncbi:topoisomerase II-associated protein PAT1 [Cytidiella melzeri]|nr:topoisomerase II-associated protein PAT1 [Cytidiella melzeri]